MAKLSPSILSANFAELGECAKCVSEAGADGHFVPNITFGADVMKSLDRVKTAPYDVHLMIENPDRYIPDFVTEKTEYITVHQEACTHLNRTVSHIRSYGVSAGVSLNPATPVVTLENILEDLDMVYTLDAE